jgi:hypothetical protein
MWGAYIHTTADTYGGGQNDPIKVEIFDTSINWTFSIDDCRSFLLLLSAILQYVTMHTDMRAVYLAASCGTKSNSTMRHSKWGKWQNTACLLDDAQASTTVLCAATMNNLQHRHRQCRNSYSIAQPLEKWNETLGTRLRKMGLLAVSNVWSGEES